MLFFRNKKGIKIIKKNFRNIRKKSGQVIKNGYYYHY